MHVLGKVMLGFAVVGILAAVVLSTMVLDVRHKWLAQVETAQQKLADSEQALADAERNLRAKEEELQALTHDWGATWSAPNSGPQPGGNGIIEIGVGGSAGLAAKAAAQNKPLPQVHLFAVSGPEESRYLGEFQVVDVRADRAAVRLARDPLPMEVASWPAGEYRVREAVPASWEDVYGKLVGEYVIDASKLRTQQMNLDIQRRHIEASQRSLAQRLAELNGDPNAPPGADVVVVDGLVQSVRRFDTERNDLLSEVDRLRHQLDTTYVALMDTIDSTNQRLELLREKAGLPTDDGNQPPVARVDADTNAPSF